MEGEVESQRQQRLSDAKQVEAKAARIKVTMIVISVLIYCQGDDDCDDYDDEGDDQDNCLRCHHHHQCWHFSQKLSLLYSLSKICQLIFLLKPL